MLRITNIPGNPLKSYTDPPRQTGSLEGNTYVVPGNVLQSRIKFGNSEVSLASGGAGLNNL
jgi:hypothetical protein